MMDRSYDLPSQAKQGLLRRLFIFIADWTLELDEAVCAWEPEQAAAQPRDDRAHLRWEDVLTHLVNKSLVIVDEHGAQPRCSPSNTIRQYAQEKLV
jgi:predicted ATPase